MPGMDPLWNSLSRSGLASSGRLLAGSRVSGCGTAGVRRWEGTTVNRMTRQRLSFTSRGDSGVALRAGRPAERCACVGDRASAGPAGPMSHRTAARSCAARAPPWLPRSSPVDTMDTAAGSQVQAPKTYLKGRANYSSDTEASGGAQVGSCLRCRSCACYRSILENPNMLH